MFADCRLVPLTHTAGVEIVQLRPFFSRQPLRASDIWLAGMCDQVLSLMAMSRMPYRVDSNLGPLVTWLPTLIIMNILLALFHTAVHLLAYG